MSTPIIGDLWDLGKTVTIELGNWLKDSVKFIFNNFEFDNPKKLFALSLIFFFIVFLFLGLFGSVGIGLNGYSGIGIGSGAVMSGTGSLGTLFTGSSDQESFGIMDTDGDGISDSNDNDIDGDGLPNSEDYDIDGDNIINQDDPTPCGEYINDCTIPVPNLCGNSLCDNFITDSEFVFIEYYYPFCSDKNLYHNIPVFCFGDGTQGDTITVTNSSYGDETYYHAICGTANTVSRLNERCYLYNSSIYYYETEKNCPLDCNSTEYNCYDDFTCDLTNYCNLFSMNCCPSGTYWAGYCTDSDISQGFCNDVNGNAIFGSGYSLPQLRNMPNHCACGSNQDCVSDIGGSSCCGSGTYHVGFCYDSYLCNVSV